MRLDQTLVENHAIQSRTKAAELIKQSLVLVNGKIIDKPSYTVMPDDIITLQATPYVSRSALKLKGYLDHSGFDVEGKNILDVGASTGGFTQILLLHNAARVSALDVGEGQLHPTILQDPRVTNYEKCDIRTFQSDECFDLLTVDVSFISVVKILDDLDRLSNSDLIILFKPQFEVGKEAKRNKSGVVTDPAAIKNSMQAFERSCALQGWQMIDKQVAVIQGKEGNTEYVYHYRKINH